MRLRKPCEHNRYDPHVTGYASPTCPGGEFLPEDALVVEKDADGEWPKWLHKAAMEQTATEVVAALAASQVGESRKPSNRLGAMRHFLNISTGKGSRNDRP